MTLDHEPAKKSGGKKKSDKASRHRKENADTSSKSKPNAKTVSLSDNPSESPALVSTSAAGSDPMAAKENSAVTPGQDPVTESHQSVTSGQAGPDQGTAAVPELDEAQKMAIVDAGYKRLCSDVTLQSNKDGFFKTFDSQVVQSVSEDQFEEFKKLTTDEERVFFVWQIPTVHSTISVQPFSRAKSAQSAEESKQEGNKHFQQKAYRHAVAKYSQMVVRSPVPGHSVGGDLLSLAYANRSAAFLHMEEYGYCLRDIEAALDAGYPARLHYKLYDRRATCQLKTGEVTAACSSLHQLQKALETADIEPKKRAIWDRDVQKKVDNAAKLQNFKPITDYMRPEQEEIPALTSQNGHFRSASAAVDVAYSADEGRYAVAAAPIAPGDVLVVEKPHASVLMSEKMTTHCLHCLKRVLAAFPCPGCSGVMFCSRPCADAAATTYHRWECRIMDVLQASGMSVLCHLALRLATMHGLEFFKALRPELGQKRAPSERPSTDAAGRMFDPTSYLSVHQLVTLTELRKPEDFFHRALMAALLLKHLRVTGFFGDVEEDAADRQLSSDELMIGGLLLRHLQLLQFNAHEVGEYNMMQQGQYKQSRSVYVGVAVYPTVSFFNHSCQGGVARSFVGDTLIIRAVESQAAGEHIFENYGPIYTHKSLRDRQHWLSSRYWFSCACVACTHNWPDYDELDSNKVQLRCQACAAGIPNQMTGGDPCGDCSGCGTKNNGVELLRQLRAAQEDYSSAMHIMDEGDPRRALRLMFRFIERSRELLVPPSRDVSLCQEAARMVIASLGSLHCIRRKPQK